MPRSDEAISLACLRLLWQFLPRDRRDLRLQNLNRGHSPPPRQHSRAHPQSTHQTQKDAPETFFSQSLDGSLVTSLLDAGV